jgi:predicted RNase H-like nuclease (RuvC/YqgF family)
MAEINKLSVNKVLDKLRSNDAKNSTKNEQLDDKIKALEEETRRLRAQRNRLKRGRGPQTRSKP